VRQNHLGPYRQYLGVGRRQGHPDRVVSRARLDRVSLHQVVGPHHLAAWALGHRAWVLGHRAVWELHLEALVLHPAVWELHLEALVLHPAVWELHLEALVLHPAVWELHLEASVLHPAVWELHLEALVLHPAAWEQILVQSLVDLRQNHPSVGSLPQQ
jgi:hypothetical protein